MSSWFKKEPTAAEAAKATKKTVRSSQRDIDKEIRDLDKTEKQLLVDIKKRAKTAGGPEDKILRTLATQLVQVRGQKEKMQVAKSSISSLGMKAQAMKSQVAMAGAMKSVGGAMAAANKAVDVGAMTKTMAEFERANMKMELSEEVSELFFSCLLSARNEAFRGDLFLFSSNVPVSSALLC